MMNKMREKEKCKKYSVTFTFDKSEMTNLYDFAKLKLFDEYFTVDWASGNICKINYRDILEVQIVHHGFYSWVEIKSKQLTVYVMCSKNRKIADYLKERCCLGE